MEINSPPKEIGPIALWRLHRGLSQEELAKRAGLTRVALVRIETGRARARALTLNKLAVALDIERSRLEAGPPSPFTTGGSAAKRILPVGDRERMIVEGLSLMLQADTGNLSRMIEFMRNLVSK